MNGTAGERMCRLCNGIPVLQSLEDAGNLFQCSIHLEPSEFEQSNSGEMGERIEVDPSERSPPCVFLKATPPDELVDGRSDHKGGTGAQALRRRQV